MPRIDDTAVEYVRLSALSAHVRWVAVGFSFLLTSVVVGQDYLPNKDGILYLLSAELFAAGAWDAALQLYNWPFYSILIAGMHLLTGMDVEMSAYVLNGLCQALLVYTFICSVSELGADRRAVLVAAVLILVAPNLNEYRSEIIRGHGYWAFSMLGLWLLLKYLRRYELRHLLGSGVALAVAGLFRVEGLVLLACTPLVLLLDSRATLMRRMRHVAWIYGCGAVLAGVVFGIVVLSGHGKDVLGLSDKPVRMAVEFYNTLASALSQKVVVLQRDFLIPYSDDYAASIVFASVLIILVTEVAAAIGPVIGGLAIFAWFRAGAVGEACQRHAIWFFIGVNGVMLAIFVAKHGFLAGRYPIGLVLLVMLFAPFGALALYRRVSAPAVATSRKKWLRMAAVAIVLMLFIDGVFSFSPGKAHVEQAAVWLSENTSPDSRVYSFNMPLLYRSERLGPERYIEYRRLRDSAGTLRAIKDRTMADMLGTLDWQQFDYIAALVSRKAPEQQAEIEAVLARPPLKVFANRRGDRVLIYATRGKLASSDPHA